MRLLPLTLLATAALNAQPIVDSWIRTTAVNAAVARVAPEVHSVRSDGDFVYVESAGLSLHSLGPWGAGVVARGPRLFQFRLPLRPERDVRTTIMKDGIIGAFLTGVPIYSPAAAVSWQDQDIWHFDQMARAASRPDLFSRRSRAPQVIGYALDGNPVYAGGGYRSGYRLRSVTARRTLPDGTDLRESAINKSPVL